MTRRLTVASYSLKGGIPEQISWRSDGIERLTARLNPHWIEQHAGEFELLHVARPPRRVSQEEADQLKAALDDLDIPLVCTIHHPLAGDRQRNGLTLVSKADEIIVPNAELRAGYEQIHDRVTLIPQGHVFPLKELDQLPPRRRIPPFSVSVLLDSLEHDPVAETIVEAIAEKARESNLYRSTVTVEDTGEESSGPAGSLLPLLASISRRERAEVEWQEMIGVEQLLAVARRADIVVVPKLTGVHCAWVEAFRDAGAAIVMPASEFSTDFRTSFPFKVFATGAPRREDIGSAIDSAAESLAVGQVLPVGADRRRHQRRLIAAQHAQLYRRAVLRRAEAPSKTPAATAV